MAGWAGFSEDELKRLKKPNRDLTYSREQEPCPPAAFLSTPPPHENKGNPRGKKNGPAQNQKVARQTRPAPPGPAANAKAPPAPIASSTKQIKLAEAAENMGSKPEPLKITDDEPVEHLSKMEMELREKSRLDQLQLEQRVIEEKNKRKKALLAKAIAERSKKTQAEAVKLKRIQKQLQALDDLVSTDISILRTRIEHACIEFSQAKKRYDRAESEFVAAKLDLQKKSQIKEQLAEHLCTIIQENEHRKANRLEELMQQLDVEADEERLELEIEVDRMIQQQENEARKVLEKNSTSIQETSSEEKEKQTKTEETAEPPVAQEQSSSSNDQEASSEHELKRNEECRPTDPSSQS